MEPGDLIPYFDLSSIRGEEISWWDFKQKKNLVILFFDPEKDVAVLKTIAQEYLRFKELNTEILAIAMGDEDEAERISETLKLPFPVLPDGGGEVASAYQVGFSPSLFVTDRFGTLYFQKSDIREEEIPLLLKETKSTLFFVESQCPECSI
jgi:peroxiredoxin